MHTASAILKAIAAAIRRSAAVAASVPNFTFGAAGFGGSPVATVNDGGGQVGSSRPHGGQAPCRSGPTSSRSAPALVEHDRVAGSTGKDNWNEAATEAQIQMDQTQAQIDAAQLALQIAQQNSDAASGADRQHPEADRLPQRQVHQRQPVRLDGEQLSATYFQSYQLAYQMCKQVERCYQFELGIQNSSFIQFGYWDSLYKGLLAGETLNHDLRRMQASYLQQNARRYELSRYVSLGVLNPAALQQLLVTGACDFTLPESLFDNDYPGHYNRRLTRVSVTVVYPSPGKFDNIKATLTLVSNQVRIKTDTSVRLPDGEPRRLRSALRLQLRRRTAEDRDGQRPGRSRACSSPRSPATSPTSGTCRLRTPARSAPGTSRCRRPTTRSTSRPSATSCCTSTTRRSTAAATSSTRCEANNLANLPTSGVKLFSAQNDFAAPAATAANPYPLTPWQRSCTAGATRH